MRTGGQLQEWENEFKDWRSHPISAAEELLLGRAGIPVNCMSIHAIETLVGGFPASEISLPMAAAPKRVVAAQHKSSCRAATKGRGPQESSPYGRVSGMRRLESRTTNRGG